MDRISPVACALSLLIACEEPPTTARPASQVPLEATAPRVSTPEKWVKRTDLELDDLLKSTCDAAVQDQKPILLEFSAAWCVDCRRLVELSSQPEVRDELARFHHVTVDVGQWDRHQALTKAFGVGMLAWWTVLSPTDCSAPIPTWPRRAEGGFEPSSSGQGARTAEDVLSWLRQARAAEPKTP